MESVIRVPKTVIPVVESVIRVPELVIQAGDNPFVLKAPG